MSIQQILLNILKFILAFLATYWWVILLVFLLFILVDIWLFYRREKYKSSIDWTLLEIKPPREVEKTPKAMEQVFSAMEIIHSSVKGFSQKWIDGKVPRWMTVEMVGRAGSIHFLVRIPSEYRNAVEASVFAQYPDVEIEEISDVDDYVNQFSSVLPNDNYDIWGMEMKLKKADGYPLRTYEYFEEYKDEQRIDPIAAVTETMSNLEPSEALWLQILMRPAGDKWVKEAEQLIKDLMSGEKKSSGTPFDWIEKGIGQLIEFMANLIEAFIQHPTWSEAGDKNDDDKKNKKNLTPGQKKVIEAIEDKIAKIGFESAIRILYVDKRDEFTRSNIASVMGALKQFNTNNLNAFTPVKKSLPKGSGLFSRFKEFSKKRNLYAKYKTRDFPKEYSVFNTEELATLYHFPLTLVKSPQLRRTEFRKGGPPSNLPTIE